MGGGKRDVFVKGVATTEGTCTLEVSAKIEWQKRCDMQESGAAILQEYCKRLRIDCRVEGHFNTRWPVALGLSKFLIMQQRFLNHRYTFIRTGQMRNGHQSCKTLSVTPAARISVNPGLLAG